VKKAAAGVTLLEMLIVVGIIGLGVAVVFPTVTSGVESLRLNAACDALVGFFNQGLNRAERRQQVVEITISKAERALWLRSSEPGFERKLTLPDGVSIVSIAPEQPGEGGGPRHFVLYPGGTAPRVAIEIANARKGRRLVRIDPITGVPQIERLE
jgi:type II secretory pathway pseudopilin PulG